MTPEEKRDFQYRAKRAIAAPVPKSVLEGSVRQASDYKACATAVVAYLRTGHQIERARLYVLRLEGMQGLS